MASLLSGRSSAAFDRLDKALWRARSGHRVDR